MAKNIADAVAYLCINTQNKDYLGNIRHWNNLKIGFEGDLLWVQGFTNTQLEEAVLKSIPYKKLYYEYDNKLFPLNSALPERNAPSVLWTPIEFGLPLTLPAFNHNYFGINSTVDIRFISTEIEQPAVALKLDLSSLGNYLEQVATIRLKPLKWVIIAPHQAFIVGTPLLPLQGETYWQINHTLIPTGLRMEFPILQPTLEKVLNPNLANLLVWNRDGTYIMIPRNSFSALSLSSYRQYLTL
ncbi:MAG: hypothetical protein ACK41O_10790 [Runella zeae]